MGEPLAGLSEETTMRRARRWPSLALALLALGSTSGRARDEPSRSPSADGGPVLVFLEPGTRVEPGRPTGWSQRVVRSVPRLASGESLPDSARATATLLRTVILADVRRRGRGFTLARVGVGNAVPFDGAEVVVTPDGPDDALDSLGVVERIVLRAATSELERGRLIARLPTFAIYRAPSVLLVDGRHEEVAIHYAFLVGPTTGTLTTLCWSTPADQPSSPRVLRLLHDATSFDAALDVRVSRRVGPLPVAWSFALRDLPPGRRLAVPRPIARQLDAPRDPAALERSLRALASRARPTRPES
jgi:hypothetical protein